MNINDIWIGLISIYNRVTPALIIILAGILAIRFSCVDVSLRRLIFDRVSKLAQSQALADFAKTAEKLRLGGLIPIAFVLAILSTLVIIGDTASWATNLFPKPLDNRYSKWDLIADQRKPDDLAIIIDHFVTNQSITKLKIPINLYDIFSYYDRHQLRLQNRFSERYSKNNEWSSSEISSTQALYGGFILLSIASFLQLLLRKIRRDWLWLKQTSALKIVFVVLILFALTLRYRLEWEWSIEREVTSDLQITTDLMNEEMEHRSPENPGYVLQDIEDAQTSWIRYQFWFARPFDTLTTSLMNVSYRPLN